MTTVRRSQPLIAAACSFAFLVAGVTARAQETVYIGGASPRGSVQVDMSVLDDLGAPGVGGQGLLPPSRAGIGAGSQRIVLTPPGQKAPTTSPQRRTTTAKPVTPRKAPAPTSKAKAPTSQSTTPTPTSATAATPAPKAAVPPQPDMPPPPPAEAVAPSPAAKTAEPARASGTPRAAKPAPTTPTTTAATPLASSAAVRLPGVESDTPAMPSEAAPTAVTPEAKPTPTPASAPAAAPTAAPAPTPTQPTPPAQTAALPPAAPSGAGKQFMRIAFSGEAAALPDSAKSELKQIAGQLSKDPALRVQVMAYASGSDDASKARRLSLSRALAVRTYLIEQGIGSTRIDVRALGNSAEGGPADRVDLAVVSR